MFKTK